MSRSLSSSFVRFLGVGVINTIVGTSVMFLCYNLVGLSYWLSSAANYVVGSVVSFYLNRRFTFDYKKRDWTTVARFVIGIIACYVLAYTIAKPLAIRMLARQPHALQENVAMAFGAVIFIVVNYATQRWFTFRESADPKEVQ